MCRFRDCQREPAREFGRTSESSSLPDRSFSKMITVAWLTLGIASVALAVIAALVLHSERQSTAILRHLNLVALNLQDVLSDLAGAEVEQREYLLTGRTASLANLEQSRRALSLEFVRLTGLVKDNLAERREVERIRYLVQQQLDELQRSVAGRTTTGSRATKAQLLTDRARKLTEALRQSIYGIDKENEGTLARLARRRRVRLASALAAICGALLLAGSYLLIGQVIVSRSASQRRETEAALRASEIRFQTLCEQAPLGIYSTDAHGFCTYTNSRWSQISGLSAAESLGHGWKKALHPDNRETVFEGWKTYAQQGASWEYRLLTPDRELRWIRALGGPIYSSAGEITGYVGSVEDITERRQAEKKLRESEVRFRNMADAAPVMIWVSGPDKGCSFFNKVWLDFTGRTMEQELGNGWAEGVHPNDLDRCLAIYISSFDARRSFQMEYRLRRADGEYRWLLDNGVPRFALGGVFEGYIGSCIDLTERKHEEELREELRLERERLAEARGMERFRLSFDEAPLGLALIRSDGLWLSVNRALCEMTGYSQSELISRGPEITHPDDRAQESLLLAQILSGERAAGRLEERFVHKQGQIIYVLLNIAAVERDEAARPVHLVVHVQDLTDRKRVEQELEASRSQMVASAHLSALGMMAGGIAHEINNPLGVIHASAENIVRMADSGVIQIPVILKNGNRISLTAERIAKIVRSLRHIAREGSADEFRPTSVRQIVDETLELCAERFQVHNIRLAVPTVIPSAIIKCRDAQICQVLLNLLQNAFDELVDRERDRWVELDVVSSPPWVIFSVSDSGPGIAPETRVHIMEPFFTTKPAGKGTGLGLSISRSIALEHGGTLELNQHSVHTCFLLKLPLSGEARQEI
jgi:PAS domain S-box-containing protein